jgi:plastocyanin
MTDTTTTDPPEPEGAAPADPPAAQPAAIEAPTDPVKEAWRTRAILPFALPFLAAIATMVWVVNLSRAFLAGGKDGSLIIVLIVTITIMIGASLMSAAKRMRQSSHLLVTSGLVILIISAGFVSLGPSEPHEEAGASGYQQPKGPAVATITVEALPNITYNQSEYPVPTAGIVEIDFVQGGGTHTVNFADSTYAGFQLNVPPKKDTGKVELKAGKYEIFCDIPGHRATMHATIVVG